MIRTALIAAAALSLAACASLQPYGPAMSANGQGFTEQRIEANRYRVTYQGVGAPQPVSDLAFRRAAELTLEQGYDWFEVTQRFVDGRPDSAGGMRPSVSIGAGSSNYGPRPRRWRSSWAGANVRTAPTPMTPAASATACRRGCSQRPPRVSARYSTRRSLSRRT